MKGDDREHAKRLLSKLRLCREEYHRGKALTTWAYIVARRQIVREAESLGVTDLLLEEMEVPWAKHWKRIDISTH